MRPMGVKDHLIHGRYFVADKFIPGGETAFAQKARVWATTIGGDPQRFGLGRADADALARAAKEYEARRIAACNRYSRSKALLDQRDRARDKVKRLMEKLGRIIRANDQLDNADTCLLGISRRPGKLRKSKCPQTRPQLF